MEVLPHRNDKFKKYGSTTREAIPTMKAQDKVKIEKGGIPVFKNEGTTPENMGTLLSDELTNAIARKGLSTVDNSPTDISDATMKAEDTN